MLETWFWTQNQCFEAWGIIWDNFKKPQIDLNAKNWVQELNVVLTLEIRNNANQPILWFFWLNKLTAVSAPIWSQNFTYKTCMAVPMMCGVSLGHLSLPHGPYNEMSTWIIKNHGTMVEWATAKMGMTIISIHIVPTVIWPGEELGSSCRPEEFSSCLGQALIKTDIAGSAVQSKWLPDVCKIVTYLKWVKECIVMPQNNACIVRLWLGGLLCPLHNTKVCCQLKICHHLASLDQHGW